MNIAEKEKVVLYLQSLGFKDQEVFEELYDHICSSFEHRESKEQKDLEDRVYVAFSFFIQKF